MRLTKEQLAIKEAIQRDAQMQWEWACRMLDKMKPEERERYRNVSLFEEYFKNRPAE
jgi:hypothetical protein